MHKTLKMLAIILASIVALLVVGAVILSLVMDPNKYKDDIIQFAKQHTGRDLKIDGKISLSFFPWLGAELPPLTLSNAPGFDKKPLAEARQAGIQVKLLPLLRKQIVIKQISLDGLRLRLAKNGAGVTNYDIFGTKGGPKSVGKSTSGTGPSLGGLTIGGIVIRDAEVTWSDQATGALYNVKNMNLKTGQLAADKPADLNLGFDFTSATPKINTRVDVDARLTLDVDKQTLDMPKLSLAVAGINLTLTDVKGSQVLDAPTFRGQLGITSFNPRKLMQEFGVKYETTDPKALAQASVNTAFSASPKNMELKNIKVTLDNTTINGEFKLNDFSQAIYSFDINIDDIDIDRYMTPAATAKSEDVKAGKTPAPLAAAPAALPLDSLRKLNADGGIKIKKLKASGIRSTDVSTRLKAKDGIINIGPSSAKLYGGNYQGNVGIDARGKELAFSMNEKVASVQVGPMLKDMQVFDNFSGTGDISLQLSGRGLDTKQITSTLAGAMAFSLKDGAIQGADLMKKVEEGRALYDQLKGKPVRVKARKDEKTAFNIFSGSAIITNGIAQNNDLILETPSMRATGKGNADLTKETLDYRMNIIQAKNQEKKCANIPLLITGPFNDLNYAPDFGEILKCQGQKQIEKAKDELLQKGLEGLFKKRNK